MGAVSGLHGVPTMVSISLNFGLAVMIALQVFGCVSGGHINPIVTIAFYIYGHITLFVSTRYGHFLLIFASFSCTEVSVVHYCSVFGRYLGIWRFKVGDSFEGNCK
jgi:glycerol uptake facilitator-like aquaporin